MPPMPPALNRQDELRDERKRQSADLKGRGKLTMADALERERELEQAAQHAEADRDEAQAARRWWRPSTWRAADYAQAHAQDARAAADSASTDRQRVARVIDQPAPRAARERAVDARVSEREKQRAGVSETRAERAEERDSWDELAGELHERADAAGREDPQAQQAAIADPQQWNEWQEQERQREAAQEREAEAQRRRPRQRGDYEMGG